ncbi:Glutamate receptor [Heracleum sosnowskyi]|uniref:Glutamate receptor n=1 Tax=Heracleum sosnowskyi TaxID=360622 RepID=A0AAD8HSF9_9APIA|nr:Glutamate receptor [Heracleum sosnowskyi]
MLSHFILLVIISLGSGPLSYGQVTIASSSLDSPVENHERAGEISIGAIFDETSRPGREAKVAIEIVIHEFNSSGNQNLQIYYGNSRGKPVRAAFAAKDLILTHGVKAILGAHTWDETSAIAEVASEEAPDVPVLSFADSMPATQISASVLQAMPGQEVQMNAIAAIIQSWGLNQVTLIYENFHTLSSPELISSQLSKALQHFGVELSHTFALTSITLNSLQKELNQLKKQKHRVFVIHATLESGYHLYQNAKKLNMTGDGYAWITTSGISDLFHSVSPKKLASMQGIVGTKTYFPENSPQFQDFRKRFRSKFRNIYPDEEFDEPGIFASQAYDAMWDLLYKHNIINLFQRISSADFANWNVAPARVVEIVNVIGRSYQSGYWTQGLGFSETMDDNARHHTSMKILKEVLWPAQPWHTERQGRILAGRSEPLKVGVPAHSLFRQFVELTNDPETNATLYGGFSIKVFEEVMKLAYVNKDLRYNYSPYNLDDYDSMVKQIALGEFDVVAGDVTILEERHEFADFSQPYTESGMVLIVPIRSNLPNGMWLFLKPFTKEMWGVLVAITIYNGFAVWLIERNHNDEFRSGTAWNQIGILFWLAFSTLFTLRGDRLHSNLSRMAMVVWLFVALIITQSYTASLSSMLTAQRLEPAIKNVETLQKMNATVGYCKGSFLGSYMIKVLGFPEANIRKYNSTDAYADALYNKTIAGIFLEVPPAKVFLAQYCKSFTKTERTFKVGGFGFAFKKDFPMLPYINRAIMSITENGTLKDLEDQYINNEECKDLDSAPNDDGSIGLNSFSVLFGITGGISTIALAMYILKYCLFPKPDDASLVKANFIRRWLHHGRQLSSRVISIELPRNPPDAQYAEARRSFSIVSDVESFEDHPYAPDSHNQV